MSDEGTEEAPAVVEFYEADYPSPVTSKYPENFADALIKQPAIAADAPVYEALARKCGGRVLELCCGTGRVSLQLARAGLSITCVDISPAMLRQFREYLEPQPAEVRERVEIVEADIRFLALPRRDYGLAFIPFNSFLLITDFADQRSTLRVLASHIAPGGRLALDVINPLAMPISGDKIPRPSGLNRRHPRTGNSYQRFDTFDAFDPQHRQRLGGWYDEIGPDQVVRRYPYTFSWRPIGRYELQLMLEEAGFELETVDSDFKGTPYSAQGWRMFFVARKR